MCLTALLDAKYALLQFGTVVSDEAYLVMVETEADFEDVKAALAKWKDHLVLPLGEETRSAGAGNSDLMPVVGWLNRL
jgi:hypothetical protein